MFEETRKALASNLARPTWLGRLLEDQQTPQFAGMGLVEIQQRKRLAQNHALKRVANGD